MTSAKISRVKQTSAKGTDGKRAAGPDARVGHTGLGHSSTNEISRDARTRPSCPSPPR